MHSDGKTGRKNPQTEGWPLGGALYQKTHYRWKANLGLSVWTRLRNSQRQSDETKSPVRSFTQLLGWSLLSRSGENRQLFRSAKMIPGSGFLTTPAPLLTASDFRQTKRPAYHTQIAQYTGHSGYSLRHWYSWSHALAFQCQSHPGTPVSKVDTLLFSVFSSYHIVCTLSIVLMWIFQPRVLIRTPTLSCSEAILFDDHRH